MSGDESQSSGDASVGVQKVASIIAGFIKKTGKSVVRYNETKPMSKSKLDQGQILQHKDLLIALRGELQRWKLMKSDADKIFKTLGGEFKTTFKMDDEQIKDWRETMVKRLRNMIWGVSQALKKECHWALESFGDHPARASGSDQREEQPAPAACEYHWDTCLNLGYKKLAGNENRLYSLAPRIEPDALGSDGIVLEWLDGSTCKMSEHIMTVGKYRLLACARANNSQSKLLELEHEVTHNKVWMIQRCDRSLLVSIYEQSKQICQVKASLFGEVTTEYADGSVHTMPNEHATIQACKAFLEPLMVSYCKDEIKDKCELKQLKDEKLKALGKYGKRLVAPKPAASATHQPKAKRVKATAAPPAPPTPLAPSAQTPAPTEIDAPTPDAGAATTRENAVDDLARMYQRHLQAHTFDDAFMGARSASNV